MTSEQVEPFIHLRKREHLNLQENIEYCEEGRKEAFSCNKCISGFPNAFNVGGGGVVQLNVGRKSFATAPRARLTALHDLECHYYTAGSRSGSGKAACEVQPTSGIVTKRCSMKLQQ
ncbi:glutamyl-tRNA(Gln) amidotransferase subunit C, chloroplastic/mitochondrial [Gossypium australe]|uniref:Glutamyl-tRNA(Gln) amidotransferase subunit C, chloroplastic/mitochondrial n=1 Tax=Gossypium australe TaxID=47621 RepID=A0A5B6UM27_9ROSI|nr:glutamyl-tRNA(Gln) amidotransferase subunit C, chloroplastic/mitochondrial [Gossypium australe]